MWEVDLDEASEQHTNFRPQVCWIPTWVLSFPVTTTKSSKRVPPHRAGPTAKLSNELQAKDYPNHPDGTAAVEDPS